MKKKLLTFVCLITCIFGLTACGSEEKLTDYDQQKLDNAIQYAPAMVELFSDYLCQENPFSVKDYSQEEIEYLCEQYFGIGVNGYAIQTGVESFQSALEEMGSITEIGSAEAKLDDGQIIAEVNVKGENKNAKAEIILSNDLFLKLESASLNPVSTMSELMGKAALNTLIGMGTVFMVLILISLIISCFGLIPKIQNAMKKRKEERKSEKETNGIDNAVAQITAREEIADETDDLELVAVIAAAIAASEGAATTDGFVVRSIRRR